MQYYQCYQIIYTLILDSAVSTVTVKQIQYFGNLGQCRMNLSLLCYQVVQAVAKLIIALLSSGTGSGKTYHCFVIKWHRQWQNLSLLCYQVAQAVAKLIIDLLSSGTGSGKTYHCFVIKWYRQWQNLSLLCYQVAQAVAKLIIALLSSGTGSGKTFHCFIKWYRQWQNLSLICYQVVHVLAKLFLFFLSDWKKTHKAQKLHAFRQFSDFAFLSPFNPYLTNGFFHHYHLDESAFIFRGVGSDF